AVPLKSTIFVCRMRVPSDIWRVLLHLPIDPGAKAGGAGRQTVVADARGLFGVKPQQLLPLVVPVIDPGQVSAGQDFTGVFYFAGKAVACAGSADWVVVVRRDE